MNTYFHVANCERNLTTVCLPTGATAEEVLAAWAEDEGCADVAELVELLGVDLGEVSIVGPAWYWQQNAAGEWVEGTRAMDYCA